MPAKTEGNYLGDWLLDEFGAPNYAREEVIILSGQNLKTGTVLGKVTASGKYVAYDNTASDGRETAAGVLIGDTDASSADKKAVALVRGPAVISKAGLTWHANNDGAAKTAGLADLLVLDIVAREGA